MLVSVVALVFSLTGTGIAASRYLISSPSQIKPSVRLALTHGVEAEVTALETTVDTNARIGNTEQARLTETQAGLVRLEQWVASH